MKTAIETICILAALQGFAAFDSATWFARREKLSHDAERLRVAYTNCAAQVREPAEDVMIPIETFPDGSVKTSVSAKKAMLFLKEGFIWAADVVVRKLDVEGAVVSQIDAKTCVIDRVAKSGWAEGPAKLRHGATVFEGEGIYFSSPEGYVMVARKSRIHSKDLKFGGLQ